MNKKLYCVNLVFLGESGVGKTSIIQRLLGNDFKENIDSTIGFSVKFYSNITFINEEEDDSEISVQIWDTAGQEKYHSLSKRIIQRADIIIFVRDNQSENFDFWFDFVENLINIESKKIIYCLNKTDLMTEGEKSNIFNELKKINKEKKHHAGIQCVSSKNSDGIFNLKSLIEEKSQEIISEELKNHKHDIKIILIGKVNVGKSSLIRRIIYDSFEEYLNATIITDIKRVKVDLKNHSSINYQYLDVSGDERYFQSWNFHLDRADIIIFVNDKDNLEVNTSIVESRIVLSDKKIICCINKKDLITDGENGRVLKIFKEKNEKLKNEPLIFVSAKTSDGIDGLKAKINEYSLDIINLIETQYSRESFRVINLGSEEQNRIWNWKCCDF